MSQRAGPAANRLMVSVQILPAYAGNVKGARLRQAARTAFRSAGGQGAGALTVMVTDDAQVRELNRLYRKVDASTDVLAFGDTAGADEFVTPPGETRYWGDIVISYARATEQAATYGHPVEEELSLLVVHGTLHLMGYDHEQADDRQKMWDIQQAALARLDIAWQP